MDSRTYALQLEKKLIEQFKENFYEKLGYEPVVLTKVQIEQDEYIPILSLDILKQLFEPFLPVLNGKKLELKSKARYRELVDLRKIYCFMARSMGYSLVTVGRSIGDRDHTTIIHNVTCFKNLVETNEAFRQKYVTILTYIKREYESPIMDQLNKIQREPEPVVLS